MTTKPRLPMQASKMKPKCYGTMFPDLAKVECNIPHKGKAFTVLVERSGGAITDRHSSVNMKEWEDCTDCPVYDTCYNLCVAKMLLHLAAQGYGIAQAI